MAATTAEGSSVVKASETLVINFLRARNLRGTKGDNVLSMLKIEFADKALGESAKVESNAENPEANYNFQAKLSCSIDDPSFLDEIAYKPVVASLIEVLPKEKKQKEEKTVLLGQVAFDLLPIVRGGTEHRSSLAVHAIPGSPLESLPADAPKPELEILVSAEQPLISEALQQDTNLAHITIESLYSPPDTFSPSAAAAGSFVAATALPLAADRDVPVVFINGSARAPADKEAPTRNRRWYLPGGAQAGAAFVPGSELAADAVEDEDGDLRGFEERDFRRAAEAEKPRVTWNAVKTSFLAAESIAEIKDRIAKSRVWPVEVFRLNQAGNARGKKSDEDGSISFHGVAYVNASPLLYPGVKRIRGAYRVYPYIETEFSQKTKRKAGIGEEAGKIAVNLMNRASSTPTGKKAPAGDKALDKKAPAADKAQDKKAVASKGQISESDDQPLNPEGQQYAEHKSYVMLEICLEKPLVPKRPPEEMAKRVAEYIPPRPMFPKRTNSAEKALADYHQQIAEISSRVLEEFRSLFSDSIRSGQLPLTPDGVESMRQELMYSLNSSGKYFAFKEQLKYAVIKVVREKYMQTAGFRDQTEMQLFLRDLFVYLVDQLQVGMRKVISLEEKVPVPAPVTDSQQLLHFAREAEVNENLLLAQQLHQERVARDKSDAQSWFDYGVFCLGVSDISKAEECFRETISLQQTHCEALILLGLAMALQERHAEAETFLEAATAHCPDSIVAWTCFSLYYDSVGNEIGAEMSLLEANKLNQAEAVAKQRALREAAMQNDSGVTQLQLIQEEKTADLDTASPLGADAQPAAESLLHSDNRTAKASQVSKGQAASNRRQTPSVKAGKSSTAPTPAPSSDEAGVDDRSSAMPEQVARPERSVFMQAAQLLVRSSASSFAERALAHEVALLGGSGEKLGPEYFMQHARLCMQLRQFESADCSLQDLLQLAPTSANAWSLLGHLKYLIGHTEAAKECYQRVLALAEDPDEPHMVILRLASIHLQQREYQLAKDTFLLACKRSPSAVAWLGVGISCYRLQELEEAEDALAEANLLNNRDPEVWAYLSLICLRTGRKLEAEQTYKYAVKVGLEDDALLQELQEAQADAGFGDASL